MHGEVKGRVVEVCEAHASHPVQRGAGGGEGVDHRPPPGHADRASQQALIGAGTIGADGQHVGRSHHVHQLPAPEPGQQQRNGSVHDSRQNGCPLSYAQVGCRAAVGRSGGDSGVVDMGQLAQPNTGRVHQSRAPTGGAGLVGKRAIQSREAGMAEIDRPRVASAPAADEQRRQVPDEFGAAQHVRCMPVKPPGGRGTDPARHGACPDEPKVHLSPNGALDFQRLGNAASILMRHDGCHGPTAGIDHHPRRAHRRDGHTVDAQPLGRVEGVDGGVNRPKHSIGGHFGAVGVQPASHGSARQHRLQTVLSNDGGLDGTGADVDDEGARHANGEPTRIRPSTAKIRGHAGFREAGRVLSRAGV